jgi:hypothetical protein
MNSDILKDWKKRACNDIFPLCSQAYIIMNLFVDFVAGVTPPEKVITELQQRSQQEQKEYNYFAEALQDFQNLI